MQKAFHHSVTERHAAAVESQHGAATTELDTALPSREDAVTICAWCPELHILAIDHRPGDHIFVSIANGCVNVFRSRAGEVGTRKALPGTRLTVSDGSCEGCRGKHCTVTG